MLICAFIGQPTPPRPSDGQEIRFECCRARPRATLPLRVRLHATRPGPRPGMRRAPPPHPMRCMCVHNNKAPEAQTGREAGTPPQATKREPQEERIAPPDTCSPREARPDTPLSWTPSLGVHRPRRQDIPRGRGAPSSRRPRLEGASPLPLLAARPARALPPTRVVRRRYRTSANLRMCP